jgi:hypothetical protein
MPFESFSKGRGSRCCTPPAGLRRSPPCRRGGRRACDRRGGVPHPGSRPICMPLTAAHRPLAAGEFQGVAAHEPAGAVRLVKSLAPDAVPRAAIAVEHLIEPAGDPRVGRTGGNFSLRAGEFPLKIGRQTRLYRTKCLKLSTLECCAAQPAAEFAAEIQGSVQGNFARDQGINSGNQIPVVRAGAEARSQQCQADQA